MIPELKYRGVAHHKVECCDRLCSKGGQIVSEGIGKKSKALRLALASAILFILFCVAQTIAIALKPGEGGSPSGRWSFISFMSGLFAWVLMCCAYGAQAKLGTEVAKESR